MSSKAAKESSGNRNWYTMEEVAKHVNPSRSVWMVINGDVLDVTKFLDQHPGGEDILLSYAGKDASDIFDSVHSTDAKRLAKTFVIGKLKQPTPKRAKQ